MRLLSVLEVVLIALASALLALALVDIWAGRLLYPFDLEWMEGGMLAHAWRLQEGLPLYLPPNPDFVPFIYPPGYPAVVAALGSVFGLSPPLGRVVSLAGILSAAAAIVYGVRQAGGRWPISVGAALAFLGAYPMAGAFYDLVRPDSLAVGLMGWSVVVALRDRPGAPVLSGMLLAAAFLCKHNLALFGFPLALGLAVRDLRHGVQFVAASAGPALAAVLALQAWSDGHFLTYLLEVPRGHELWWSRAYRETPAELGNTLPMALGAVGWALYLRPLRAGERELRSVPTAVAVVVPMVSAVLVAWVGTYVPYTPASGLLSLPAAIGYWGLTMGVLGPLLRVGGTVVDRYRGVGPGDGLSWQAVLGLGVGAAAILMSLLMRAHDGGFINVHMPAYWVLSFGFGVVLARFVADRPTPAVRAVVTAAMVGQLLWAWRGLDRERLVPTEDDVATGWAFVERARPVEGRVLSPFAAWLPVYAGKPPSIHAMAVWDLDRAGGVYEDEVGTIRDALRDDYWPLAFGGNHHFVGPLMRDYEPLEVITEENTGELLPRTGFRAHPWRTMVPRVGAE